MRRLRVAVRRRPIFPHETGAGEFDVVSCKHKNIVIHDCRMHPDCRRLFVSHNTFTFDRVYDEHCSSADVYAGSVAPLVSMAATQCKAATVLMYGQTGSGKTFTMAHLIKHTDRPTLVLSHNKTLAAQLYGELKGLFPDNAVEYFVSYYDYYQPEAYVPSSDTYIQKDLLTILFC